MSLRARLFIGMGLVALVLVLAAFVITTTTRSHLVGQLDDQLRQSSVPGRYFDPGHTLEINVNSLASLYIGVLLGDDSIDTKLLPNLTEQTVNPPDIDPAEAREAAAAGRLFTTGAAGFPEHYRMMALVDTRSGAIVLLGLPLNDVDSAVNRLIVVEVIATLAVLAVLGLVTSWMTRLGVRPIKQMTFTAMAIADGDLSQRVPEATHDTEAAQLGTALNKMMHNIQEAFDERAASESRLRQFVADASHELRTPITTIRGYAELYRSGGLDDGGELDEAMRRTEQEAKRMGSLVDDMLLLARLDQGRPLERTAVALDQLARDAARDARAVEPERTVTVDADQPVVVLGDEGRLRQVVSNLVGNALVHTPKGTPVHVGVHRAGDRGVLDVIDEGPGMDPTVATRVFERFFRADPSRSRHRGGSGLGLSIVQATVGAHGGTVKLDTAPGRGTKIRVELPLILAAPPPRQPPDGAARLHPDEVTA